MMPRLQQETFNLINIRLSPKQLTSFEIYERELTEWNTRFNLTAIDDPNGIRIKHFLDSLTCVFAWSKKTPKNLIDIGTGAGFPGIPLKIIMPELQLTLVESIGKKVNFCKHIVEVLGLNNVEIIQERAEELGQSDNYREKFDCATARAVANMSTLSEYLFPLVKIGGVIVAQKGENAPAEAHAANRAIHLLGGRLRQLYPVTLPGVAEDRYLVIVDKIAASPPQYPRRVGIPSKSPISDQTEG